MILFLLYLKFNIFEKIDNGSLKTTETLTVSKTAKEMGGTQIWLEEIINYC